MIMDDKTDAIHWAGRAQHTLNNRWSRFTKLPEEIFCRQKAQAATCTKLIADFREMTGLLINIYDNHIIIN